MAEQNMNDSSIDLIRLETDLEEVEEDDRDDYEEISIRGCLVESLKKMFRNILTGNNMLLFAGVLYVFCCMDRYSYTLQDLLEGKYYFILGTAIALFTLWWAVRLLTRAVHTGTLDRVRYMFLYSGGYLLAIILGRTLLEYIQFAEYSEGWHKPLMFVQILISDLLYNPNGFPYSYQWFAVVVLVAGTLLSMIGHLVLLHIRKKARYKKLDTLA